MTPEEFRRAMFGKRPSELLKEEMEKMWKIPENYEQALQYESPIQIIFGEMQTKLENDITGAVNAVLPYDIQINKEELIKALQYDRDQYKKGWEDARKTYQKPNGEWINEYDRLKCPFCGMAIDDEVHWLYSKEFDFNFCPNCGAQMDMRGEEE